MELYKSKENHKDPVKTAKSNYFALGFFYIILGVLVLSSGSEQDKAIISLLAGLSLFYIGYLLSKRKMLGVYLGWVFVIFGVCAVLFNGVLLRLAELGVVLFSAVLLRLIVIAYFAYWNYKAGEILKNSQPPSQL